jgi:diguanylate cyclase (GGDEF)-like protein/PAS domain S-box-containing protein
MIALGGAFAVLYLASAKWAAASDLGGPVLIWFPPAGVAIAFLILTGLRWWPLVMVVEMISTAYVTGFGGDFGFGWNAVNAFVITGAYAATAAVLRSVDLDPRLHTVRDVLWLIGVGVVAGPLLASVAGVLVQLGVGLVETSGVWEAIGIFWVGDIVGVAAVAPPLLVAAAYVAAAPNELRTRLLRPSTVLIVLELAVPASYVGAVVAWANSPARFLQLALVPIAFVAIRHGVGAAAFSCFTSCAVLVTALGIQDSGALERADLQLLMAAMVLTGLLLGALEAQRRDALAGQRQLTEIIEASPDFIGRASEQGQILYLNPAARAALGAEHDVGTDALAMFEWPGGEDDFHGAFGSARRNGAWIGDNVVRTDGGRRIDVSQLIVAHRDGDGRVAHFSTVCRDITDRRQLEAQLTHQALYDDTTGLANRVLLAEQLGRALRSAEDQSARIAIAMIDPRRFRSVNETLGYEVGDRVLTAIASRLSESTRASDTVARHGGDVFAVMLTEVPDELDAIARTQQFRSVLAQPLRLEGRVLVLDACVGIAISNGNGTDALDLLRSAEIALSRAKEAVEGLALFDPEMDRRARERLELETDLRAALDTEEWWLAYQPIAEISSGRMVACEALLRWDHPKRGAVAPGAIVPMAESTGLIVPLGVRILERACAQATTWREARLGVEVSVNVSGRQLHEEGFTSSVGALLERCGLEPAALQLEITESVLAADDAAVAAVRSLHDLGCTVAMDDFGTGYSSLAGLRDLPIDVLKIDRAFITDLTTSRRARAAVEAIMGVATALDLVVVAEGVETETQLDVLTQMGCDRVQGFHIAHPQRPELCETLLTGV